MIQVAGVPLAAIFSGGSFLAVIGLILYIWIKGMPDRTRAAADSKSVAAAELAQRYTAWRQEIHELKNETAKVAAKQAISDRHLADCLATNRHNKNRMSTMLFLIRLLIRELKRIAPASVIVKQAESTLEHMDEDIPDPTKSDALNSAEGAVNDAAQTLASTEDTCAEVKRAEKEGG